MCPLASSRLRRVSKRKTQGGERGGECIRATPSSMVCQKHVGMPQCRDKRQDSTAEPSLSRRTHLGYINAARIGLYLYLYL